MNVCCDSPYLAIQRPSTICTLGLATKTDNPSGPKSPDPGTNAGHRPSDVTHGTLSVAVAPISDTGFKPSPAERHLISSSGDPALCLSTRPRLDLDPNRNQEIRP